MSYLNQHTRCRTKAFRPLEPTNDYITNSPSAVCLSGESCRAGLKAGICRSTDKMLWKFVQLQQLEVTV